MVRVGAVAARGPTNPDSPSTAHHPGGLCAPFLAGSQRRQQQGHGAPIRSSLEEEFKKQCLGRINGSSSSNPERLKVLHGGISGCFLPQPSCALAALLPSSCTALLTSLLMHPFSCPRLPSRT